MSNACSLHKNYQIHVQFHVQHFFSKHVRNIQAWKYNNTRNTLFYSISKISFIFLITHIDSTNDQNTCVELFKDTFTH